MRKLSKLWDRTTSCFGRRCWEAVENPDMGVVDEMKNGTELVGCIAKTGIRPTKFQPASVGLDELRDIACRERNSLAAQFTGLCDGDIGDQVWQKTLQEVETGALVGPIPLDQVPPEYPLSRRFGIRQGAKVRCVDDFSRSSVNSSVQSCESPKPHTLDVFAALCVHLMSELEEGEQWYGRTFGLVGAYRQCAVKPSSAPFSYIVVQHPQSHELVAFRMRALPFGSICSVHSFLRMSHSLWYVLVKEFKLLMANYFDDFVSLSKESERAAVTSCVQMYFKLLGCAFAETGEKAPEFSQLFQALGVNICVQSLHVGLVTVGNTDSRRRELIEFIAKVIEKKQLARHDALRLRGRLQCAAGQVFGRIAKCALAAVSWHAYNSSGSSLSEETAFSLLLHKRFLELGKPRELRTAAEKPWFIQTDACYDSMEDGIMAGIGAVLFNPADEPAKFFSHRLTPSVVVVLWIRHPKRRPFMTVNFSPSLLHSFCGVTLWPMLLWFYTDNNGVRDTLIACTTRNPVAKQILLATMALETLKQITPWYARVPTDSNLSDGPSRLSCEKVVTTGAQRCDVCGDDLWVRLVALAETWGDDRAAISPSGSKTVSDSSFSWILPLCLQFATQSRCYNVQMLHRSQRFQGW